MIKLTPFFAGILVLGFAVAGLFFFRFYKQSRDRLFLLFGISFMMMAVNRLALAFTGAVIENQMFLYIIRLAAFVLILVAIVDKNLLPKRAEKLREEGERHDRAPRPVES